VVSKFWLSNKNFKQIADEFRVSSRRLVTIHVPSKWKKNQCFTYHIIADNAIFMIILSFYRMECE